MFLILSAKTTVGLETLADKYDIKELGSLTISNGHYYLAIIGVPKDTEEPKIDDSKPKEEDVPQEKPTAIPKRKKNILGF